jgi:hypothetical protein
MFKKLFISVAPLLAIAAFAVMAVTAQAGTQQWYRSGVKLTEGKVVPIVVFGGKVNLNQTSGFGEADCKTVGGGTIENPAGSGAGVGRTNSLTLYECKGATCEAEALKATGMEGRVRLTTQNNPAATQEPGFPGWSDVLEESTVAGVSSVREKIGEPFEKFQTPSPPGMLRETQTCELAATKQVLLSTISEGELKPEIGVAKSGMLNGSSAANPSTIKFSGASTGALRSELAGEDTFLGSLKYLGYNEQELITVKPTPLTFAGLKSATTCIPGPIGEGGTGSYHLSWEAATDNVTPPGSIVYNIYQATTAGGEDFSQPTYTTAPGATAFDTPQLSAVKTFYFVVRARDQAGNEDSNKVEKEGQNLCV